MSLRMPFLDSRGMNHSWDRNRKAATVHGGQLRLTPDSLAVCPLLWVGPGLPHPELRGMDHS